MHAKVSSVAIVGMDARPVEVEVNLAGGLPDFQIVGLPSAGVREARKRVESAIVNSGEDWPQKRITANLAPGDLRKDGPMFDLPLAVGVLAAGGRVNPKKIAGYVLVGELALDGRLRPVRGVLAASLAARAGGAEGVVVPRANASEAGLVPGVEVFGADHLVEALAFLNGELQALEDMPRPERLLCLDPGQGPDLSEVKGQALARRALEIAAVGSHNVLMVGPPGAGKTMLARRLPGILPPLSVEEALDVTRVWSVAGLLTAGQPMVTQRPFRSPHHQASAAGVIGGGHLIPRPGEVSLAHNGILFLDEFPLFSRAVLEGLRQPLEEGFVTVARQGAAVRFPANVCLVGAANPCMCGRAGDGRAACDCSPGRLDSYRSRLSGPLLDRIDLHVEVGRLTPDELLGLDPSESSSTVRARVIEARKFQKCREPVREMAIESLAAGPRRFLSTSLSHENFSPRGLARSLRVARTIADLEGSESVDENHLAEAFQFRRGVWDR